MALAPGDGSGLSAGGLSALGGGVAGLAGLGYLLASGPAPLPSQFGTVAGYSPQQYNTGQSLVSTGTGLEATGAGALTAAQNEVLTGALTPEQQAALTQTKTGETAQAVQMYESMGRNPTKDTSFLNTGMTIDANVLAAAQAFVTSNISAFMSVAQNAFSAGASFVGEGLQFESAAASNLLAAGNAQVQQNTDWSNSIAAAFGAVGKAFGAALPMSDERIKDDIFPVGELDNGVGVYTFRFRGDRTFYLGTTAQDARKVVPEAVVADEHGILHVDYSKLGSLRINYYA